jgi:hypothetical protein
MRAALSIVVALAVVSSSAWATAPPTFESRVPYPPLVEKLRASGGSFERVLRIARAADLDALASGKRYKFVVDERGTLAVAPLPADAPANEYVHPILARGERVRTAGGLRVERDGGRLTAVILDQDSKSYCPTFDSLQSAADALAAAGVSPALLRREDHRPSCAPPR